MARIMLSIFSSTQPRAQAQKVIRKNITFHLACKQGFHGS